MKIDLLQLNAFYYNFNGLVLKRHTRYLQFTIQMKVNYVIFLIKKKANFELHTSKSYTQIYLH